MTGLFQNFSRYTVIGVVFYVLSVGFNGLLIDVWHFPTLTTSLLVLVGLFVLKFWVSVRLGVIHNRFGLYLVSNTILSVTAPFFVWLAVDRWGLPASASTAAILGAVFLLRYVVMGQLGLLSLDTEKGDARSS